MNVQARRFASFFIFLTAVSALIPSAAFGASTWTDQTLAGSRNWYAITSSADGTKLAAADQTPGDVWTYVYTPTGPGRRIYLHGNILLHGIIHL
jgi:hypothetical protein